jgi:ketosteroid isomerase-like protein
VYHYLGQRKVREMFAQLSLGNFEPALASLAPEFEQIFAGNHPLGGTRRDPNAFRRWFERMYRLFPELEFEVISTASSGPPWNQTLVAEWVDRARPVDGGTYENHGVHVINLSWGRVRSIHAYLDTQVVSDVCRRLYSNGHAEAGAAMI